MPLSLGRRLTVDRRRAFVKIGEEVSAGERRIELRV
jgi:hypothetical protein